MTCETCGKKPKNTIKNFTKSVIEIDNPKEITLLRKVIIPASLGDDTTVPPAVGKYKNVILWYEANRHTYIYSSDGIPTLLEVDIPQELLDRIDTLEIDVDSLQQELDDFKNSPDVVDIVATYADLLAYDTSGLGDKDVIRVLTDETHDDASSYYRWNKTSGTWTFIGITGPYYTESEIDTLLGAKQDTLTFDDTPTQSSTNPVTSDGIKSYVDTKSIPFQPYPSTVNTTGTTAQFIASIQALDAPVGSAYLGTVELSDLPASLIQEEVQVFVYDNNLIYCVMYSADVSPYSWWCNSYDFRGWEPMGAVVVQSTGISTTDVMSQNATTSMVFADPSTKRKVQIGDESSNSGTDGVAIGRQSSVSSGEGVAIGKSSQASSASAVSIGGSSKATSSMAVAIGDAAKSQGTWTTAVGYSATANGGESVAVGSQSSTSLNGNSGVAIGRLASVQGTGGIAIGSTAGVDQSTSNAVAIGSGAHATANGQFDISLNGGSGGYNNSAYRLLTGLYSPQNEHDAANKGYVDSRIMTNAGAPTTATVGTKGQVLEDTTNGKLYICTAIDITDPQNPSYTWTEVGTGGSGAGIVELTSADYDYPTNSPDGIALWELDEGIYHVDGAASMQNAINLYLDTVDSSASVNPKTFIISRNTNGTGNVSIYEIADGAMGSYVTSSSGTSVAGANPFLMMSDIVDNLSSSYTTVPLSANQGRVLDGKIPVVTLQTTDPGEGVALAANSFIGVYQ